MFTGIVEEVGSIKEITRGAHSARVSIQAGKILTDLKTGDSVAVNGICLTVTSLSAHDFTADVMHETISRSSLAQLKKDTKVNLERAMAANGRFGGHMVSGHVDGIGTVLEISRDDNAIWYTIKAEANILHYIVEKGSVAIDGISLTVARLAQKTFSVSVIPHTIEATTLGECQVGDWVNLETDIIGKYVEKLLEAKPCGQQQSHITKEFLAQHGF